MTPTTLPADALGGGLLDEGVRVTDGDGNAGVFMEYVLGGLRCHVAWLGLKPGEERVTRPLPSTLSLDLTHWTARVQVCRVVATGERCPGCPTCQPVPCEGESTIARHMLGEGACADCGGIVRTVEEARRHERGVACAERNEIEQEPAITVVFHCDGTGWTRRPAPAWHLLPVSEGGQLPDDLAAHSARLLAGHVRLVDAGRGGIAGVVRALTFPNASVTAGTVAGKTYWWSAQPGSFPDGFGWSWGDERGPETGDAAIECLHACFLRAGFALASGPDLVMPEGA